MDKEKYEIILIGIIKEGKWFLYIGKIEDLDNKWIQFFIECFIFFDRIKKVFVKIKDNEVIFIDIDVVFLVLYGLNGEDGIVQGFLELFNILYVGCGVFLLVICMDKVFVKKFVFLEGILQGYFLVVYKNEYLVKKDYFIR